MKTKFTLLFALILVISQAQDYRFGRVSKEELQKEKSLIEPDAAGEILYEKVKISIEFNELQGKLFVQKEVEGRIKVYDKDKINEDYLQLEVNLRAPSSNRDKLISFRGSTYNLENGKSVETRVRNSDIFKERINKYWESEKFAFPNVQNGSVLEYKYEITSPFYREIDRWYFQKDIPVLYSEFYFSRPEFMIYAPDERGELRLNIKNNKYGIRDSRFSNHITEYSVENVKSLQREPFVFNPNNLKSSLRFELASIHIPGVMSENYTTTWAQIGKDLMHSDHFGGQLKGNNFLDQTVENLVNQSQSPFEKTQSIFDHVKDNYTWNRFYSVFTDTGIRSTFREKTGNAADINLMLVSMLQKAGLNAHPIVLSTVQNLIVNYSFPSMTSLDFVIASVEINNQIYLMDATEKYSGINMLPLRDLNHRGFRVLPDGNVQEIPLTNFAESTDKEVMMVNISPEGKISGRFNQTRDQYFAMTDKMRQSDDPKGFERNYLSDFSFEVSDFKIDENQERGILRYSFSFSDLDAVEVIGNKMIINPLFFRQIHSSSFNQDTRNYPLEFGSIISKSKSIRIQIPEGYKIESLPKDNQFMVQGNVAGYIYKIKEENGLIVLDTVYKIGHSILPAEYYGLMKDFENKQINTENQQIVLVKI